MTRDQSVQGLQQPCLTTDFCWAIRSSRNSLYWAWISRTSTTNDWKGGVPHLALPLHLEAGGFWDTIIPTLCRIAPIELFMSIMYMDIQTFKNLYNSTFHMTFSNILSASDGFSHFLLQTTLPAFPRLNLSPFSLLSPSHCLYSTTLSLRSSPSPPMLALLFFHILQILCVKRHRSKDLILSSTYEWEHVTFVFLALGELLNSLKW